MYIVNQSGVTHSIPDDWAMPAGARKATKEEIAAYEGATTPTVTPTAEPSPALMSAIAEKDAEIARLQAALAEAATKGKK